jgi:hypothetical protein
MTKREFLTTTTTAAAAAAAVLLPAQQSVRAAETDRPTKRIARTTKLFKVPGGFPNGLSASPEGLWIAEQKLSGAQARSYGLPEPKSLEENCWLVDWSTGKVLNTVVTPSRNTSGMAVGGGFVWMVANAPPQGVFQVDMNSRLVSHRQIPLGPANDGGGSHGALWQDGKLWIAALRLRANVRVDPKTWTPEFMIPFYQAPNRTRYHDIAWDNGSIWQVVGNDCKRYSEYHPALVRHDAATGKVQEVVDFAPGSCDPHGLTMHNGKLYGCDAGIHPNWPNNDSPAAGWVFQIDIA